jgi:hypothetical protein
MQRSGFGSPIAVKRFVDQPQRRSCGRRVAHLRVWARELQAFSYVELEASKIENRDRFQLEGLSKCCQSVHLGVGIRFESSLSCAFWVDECWHQRSALAAPHHQRPSPESTTIDGQVDSSTSALLVLRTQGRDSEIAQATVSYALFPSHSIPPTLVVFQITRDILSVVAVCRLLPRHAPKRRHHQVVAASYPSRHPSSSSSSLNLSTHLRVSHTRTRTITVSGLLTARTV